MSNPFIEKSCYLTILNSDGTLIQDCVQNPMCVSLERFDKLHELIADMRMLFGNSVILRLDFSI